MRTLMLACVLVLPLASCAVDNATRKTDADQGVVHHATAEQAAAVHSREPITAPTAVLYVNGLGCPQCASNIDLQMERIKGVQKVAVDLGTGTVTLDLWSKNPRPSPHQLSEAVADAGFTLVKIETR